MTRDTYVEQAASPRDYVELFTRTFGPAVAIRGALADDPSRAAAFDRDFLDFAVRANTGDPTAPAEYRYENLLVIARKQQALAVVARAPCRTCRANTVVSELRAAPIGNHTSGEADSALLLVPERRRLLPDGAVPRGTKLALIVHKSGTSDLDRCAIERLASAAAAQPSEEACMAGVQELNFDSPDETRTPPKTRVEVVRTGGGATAARIAFEPGWKWSECLKPVVGTEKCQVHHVGFIQSGTMHVVHDDGTELELGPGNAYEILPGHDAWVVGDERCIAFEFESRAAEEYARE